MINSSEEFKKLKETTEKAVRNGYSSTSIETKDLVWIVEQLVHLNMENKELQDELDKIHYEAEYGSR